MAEIEITSLVAMQQDISYQSLVEMSIIGGNDLFAKEVSLCQIHAVYISILLPW